MKNLSPDWFLIDSPRSREYFFLSPPCDVAPALPEVAWPASVAPEGAGGTQGGLHGLIPLLGQVSWERADFISQTRADICSPWCLGTLPSGPSSGSCFKESCQAFLAYFCLHPQGATPEDFSNLPPEQRRKKLQQKVDELNKEIQKEMDQR